ncbi:MAG TPA: prepilin peptidase [Solirubrobacteraceae bacterium]|nr:prepilin peptidase [Solirubrobacteraceae bacterium]
MLAAVLGAVFGSFLNVVAYRLPRGESLSRPRSRCPGCLTQIRAYDNVPVLSWLALRGRCRTCREPISARYPLVEAATGALCALVVLAKGPDEDALLGLVLVLLLVPVTLIDIDHRIIPNRLMLIGAILAPPLLLLSEPDALVEHLLAAVAAGGFFLVAVLAYPRGMGMGDVKLAFVLGLFLGRDVGPALFVALVAGTLVGAAVIARKGATEGRKTAVPFGPFLALGALVALFAGDAMVEWYLSTFA